MSITVAYADPPYLGQGDKYDHPDSEEWNDLERHEQLIERLVSDYPDGWVLSASAPSLRALLPLIPEEARLMVWVKPFAAFKKGVNPSHAWEPVIFYGGRGRTDEHTYIRDWVAENITLEKGLTGAKPKNVCFWMFDVLNLQPGDTLDDLFPGTGIVSEAWEEYQENYSEIASRVNRVSVEWEMGKGVHRKEEDR